MSVAGDMLMDWAAVCEQLGISRRTLWSWVKSKRFPPPDVAQGRKFRRWRESTVKRWRESR